MIEYIGALLGAVVAFVIANKFPDLDLMFHHNQNLPWIVHRNIIFHSALIVFVFWLVTTSLGNPVCFFCDDWRRYRTCLSSIVRCLSVRCQRKFLSYTLHQQVIKPGFVESLVGLECIHRFPHGIQSVWMI